MRFTKTTLSKIEAYLKEQGYTVRYEKGNFTSGYCLVQAKKIVIINKFFKVEARIRSLLDILAKNDEHESFLSKWAIEKPSLDNSLAVSA